MLPGSEIITGSSDKSLKRWSATTFQCLSTMNGHTDLVRCVDANQEVIVSGSYDKTVRIWNRETGEALKVLTGHTGKIFKVLIGDSLITSVGNR